MINEYNCFSMSRKQMINELEKHDAIHIWNNHYQGSFTPLAFINILRIEDFIPKLKLSTPCC